MPSRGNTRISVCIIIKDRGIKIIVISHVITGRIVLINNMVGTEAIFLKINYNMIFVFTTRHFDFEVTDLTWQRRSWKF